MNAGTSKAPRVLRGITWAHTRGFVPKVATAQRFIEQHPGVAIEWEKRSLLDFGEQPVSELIRRFDLLVIDHPSIGAAAAAGWYLPLDELLPAGTLEESRAHPVGAVPESYTWAGRTWALAVDVACPVAHARADWGDPWPTTWGEVEVLMRTGRVLAPFIHTDAIHHFFMFCHVTAGRPFAADTPGDELELAEITSALELTRAFAAALPERCLSMNPIAVLEALAAGEADYCPAAFGYINYARPGYATAPLAGGSPPDGPDGRPLRTTLGGAGLAISRHCADPELAAAYAAYVAAPATQAGLYLDAGGQPAHRAAWRDAEANRRCGGWLRNTLPALDRSWLRPRYPGYLHFQDQGAYVVHEVAAGQRSPRAGAERLQELYRESRVG